MLNLAEMGSNIVSVPQLYGTTYTLFAHILPGQGIGVRFAESDQPDAIEKLIDDKTRAVFCESVGNPAGNICDIEALAAVAARHGVPLVVDNTVATPLMLRPIEYGADIIVHSLTKFLGGHGTTLGGADCRQRPISVEDACAALCHVQHEPDASYHGLVYTEHFGEAAYIARCRSVYQRTTGAVLSPLSAFLLLQGIETVALRVERHVENARRVAEFLRDDSRVAWVNYAGFSDNPYHALAQKYFGGRACSLLTFGIAGGLEAGKRFYDALKLFKRLVNMGDAKSLACHPASTTHRQMSAQEQEKAGVRPEMIRLSVGIEHIDDILADLDQALAAAQARRSPLLAAECRSAGADDDAVLLDTAQSGPASEVHAANCVTVGLINNMPDAALAGDRAAIHRSHSASARNTVVRLLLFPHSRSSARRGGAARHGRHVIATSAELWDARLDGLIVPAPSRARRN